MHVLLEDLGELGEQWRIHSVPNLCNVLLEDLGELGERWRIHSVPNLCMFY